MRISTNTIYDAGKARISDLQSGMVKTQEQISSNRRILSPSDDPIASARVLGLQQAKSVNDQFAVNRQNARNTLEQEEGALAAVTNLIQNVQTLAVSAGNAALDDTQRKYIATELQSNFDELLGLANTRDAAGNFLFAGFRATAQPFNATPTGATYSGDQGQRMLQIGPSRQISLNDSGINIFERVRTGNGTFVTAAGAGNKGGGIADLGSVTDPAALTNHDYRIDFHVSGGATTYDVIDTTAAAAVSSGNAYTDGASIAFQGLQFQVKGAPADGDSFTVAPSGNASIFSTMRDLINVLNQPATDTAGRANLSNGLIRAGAGLNSMLDNVSTVRASLGTRLKELDSLDSAGSDRDLQYSQALSDLQDVDYAKAISDLSQQQMTLQAAQKSFVAVSGLSLFSFI